MMPAAKPIIISSSLRLTFLKKNTTAEPTIVHPHVKSPAKNACLTTGCDRNQSITSPYSLKSIIQNRLGFSDTVFFLIPVMNPLERAFPPVERQTFTYVVLHIYLAKFRNLPPFWLPFMIVSPDLPLKGSTKKIIIHIPFFFTRISETWNSLQFQV